MHFDDPKSLPCGCKRCGCLCEEHSLSGLDEPCARHGVPIVARWIAGEVAALAALALLVSCIAVWSAVLAPSYGGVHIFNVDAALRARH